jgi:serine/threonine-protein kinase HipA
MTQRFDREGARARHHIQTLCAMAHLDFRRRGTNSYAQCFHTILELGLPREDLVEAYRRMVFSVLARNCDDHTKNVSFRMRQGESWRLAPAYDVTFAHNPAGAWTNQHLMSVNAKFRGITRADLLVEADRYGIGEAKAILDQVHTAFGNWPAHAAAAGVAKAEGKRIGGLHLRV